MQFTWDENPSQLNFHTVKTLSPWSFAFWISNTLLLKYTTELPSVFWLSISVINKDKADSRIEKYDEKWNRNLLLKESLLCNSPLMFSPVLGLGKGWSLKVLSNANHSGIPWFIWMYLLTRKCPPCFVQQCSECPWYPYTLPKANDAISLK